MLKKFVYSFLAMLFVGSQAVAQTYPESVAFEASMEAVGQVLSSPALPSLDNDGKFSITPVAGIVTIEGVDYPTYNQNNGEENNNEVRGKIDGQIAGLTFNHSGTGDLGYFAITAWSKVDGAITLKGSGTNIMGDVRNITAESYVGAIGVTYRLVGDAKSKFAMGLFGGPALISSKTVADLYHTGGITKTKLSPNLTGTYLGVQFTLRFGEFRINPYANLLGSFAIECLQPEYSGSEFTAGKFNTCNNGERGISTLAMIGGAGINVGYGRFQFGLITRGGSPAPGLKATPIMLSFRISL